MNPVLIASYVLAFFLGSSLMALGASISVNADHTQRIKKLEADVRKATGAYLDQGERFQDELEAARNEKALELYEMTRRAEACEKAKKP